MQFPNLGSDLHGAVNTTNTYKVHKALACVKLWYVWHDEKIASKGFDQCCRGSELPHATRRKYLRVKIIQRSIRNIFHWVDPSVTTIITRSLK